MWCHWQVNFSRRLNIEGTAKRCFSRALTAVQIQCRPCGMHLSLALEEVEVLGAREAAIHPPQHLQLLAAARPALQSNSAARC